METLAKNGTTFPFASVLDGILCTTMERIEINGNIIPFLANVPILYPLKTGFLVFSGGIK